jgi:hypothetical protein
MLPTAILATRHQNIRIFLPLRFQMRLTPLVGKLQRSKYPKVNALLREVMRSFPKASAQQIALLAFFVTLEAYGPSPTAPNMPLDSSQQVTQPLETYNFQSFFQQLQVGSPQTVGLVFSSPQSGGSAPQSQQLANVLQQLQDDLDSDNEISEMTSMMLQMVMDARSTFSLMFSNVVQMEYATEAGIIANIKD